MDLLVMPAASLNGTGEPVAIDSPQLLAAGRFTDSHPPEWKQAAYAAQSLLAVIGPSDAPRLDPGKAQKSPHQALSGLWIFNAAIAVVFLVMP